MLRYLLLWTSLAAGIALALWLRLGWIESADVAHRCLDGLASVGCTVRGLAVVAFSSGALRWVTIACAALALLWKHPLAAWLAALVGGAALVLYSAEAGAAAVLIGVLRLARLHAASMSTPGDQHRDGEQGVAQQP